jgi:tripartite-type tricarboxylate transporter receptor subunit TctC
MTDRTNWPRRRRKLARVLAIAIALFGLAAAAPARAEKYPSRSIRVIVPSSLGGPTDVMARLVCERLAMTLGQPLTIDNQPDGAGSAGLKMAAAAAPDGYTLLFGSPGPLAIGPAIYSDFGYDLAKTFTAVAMIAISPQVLVVNPQVPTKSVHDLIAYAKANPGKLKYGSPGYATEPHLLGELLKTSAGIDIMHVRYKGATRAVADLVAGHVQMLFDGPAAIAPHIAAGQLRALAVASETRARLLPDVPTMIESGFGRFIASYWAGVVAPAGTPGKIVGRLNGAINDALRSSDLQAALAKLGEEPKIGSPQDAASFMAAEAVKWAVVAKAVGIKPSDIAGNR